MYNKSIRNLEVKLYGLKIIEKEAEEHSERYGIKYHEYMDQSNDGNSSIMNSIKINRACRRYIIWEQIRLVSRLQAINYQDLIKAEDPVTIEATVDMINTSNSLMKQLIKELFII